MANVIISSAAENDYTESLPWYAAQSVVAANDFDAEFDRAFVQIANDVVMIAVAHGSCSPDYWLNR